MMDGHQDLHASQSALSRRLKDGAASRLSMIVGDTADAVCGVLHKHRVTPQEMRVIVSFAQSVGFASDAHRNEWVLLLDTMGITGAIEAANLSRPVGGTPQTLLGPFYRENAPAKKDGDTISIDSIGTPLCFVAHVVDLDGEPIAGATVDVWQANGDGVYENQDPDSQPEFNLRGVFQTGPNGRVTIRTVRPAGYDLPDDGPVAELMGLLGLPLKRPAHMQFRVDAKGFQPLVTQVFDGSDPHLDADPLFCVSPELVTDFGDPTSEQGCNARFTFKLARQSRSGKS